MLVAPQPAHCHPVTITPPLPHACRRVGRLQRCGGWDSAGRMCGDVPAAWPAGCWQVHPVSCVVAGPCPLVPTAPAHGTFTTRVRYLAVVLRSLATTWVTAAAFSWSRGATHCGDKRHQPAASVSAPCSVPHAVGGAVGCEWWRALPHFDDGMRAILLLGRVATNHHHHVTCKFTPPPWCVLSSPPPPRPELTSDSFAVCRLSV